MGTETDGGTGTGATSGTGTGGGCGIGTGRGTGTDLGTPAAGVRRNPTSRAAMRYSNIHDLLEKHFGCTFIFFVFLCGCCCWVFYCGFLLL